MIVVKVGGAAIGSPEAIEGMIEILRGESLGALVVSAFPGLSEELLLAAGKAERRSEYSSTLDRLREVYKALLSRFLPAASLARSLAEIEGSLALLRDLLRGVELLRDLSKRSLDQILNCGDSLSALHIARILEARGLPAHFVDAGELIKTDGNFEAPLLLEEETRLLLASKLGRAEGFVVIPASVASSLDGIPTRLARGGGDLSASILGAGLGAQEIRLWSDGPGILSADAGLVPDAFAIEEISYEEALEMNHFGAEGLCPSALLPAMKAGIPIRLLDASDTAARGTLILKEAGKSRYPVRGLASIASLCLLSIRGPGMPGVTGIAGRMFGALARDKINVILITQASSELSICCAVGPEEAEKGKRDLEAEFAFEISAGLIAEPSIERELCAIAVVGDRMRRKPGIAGKVFAALGRNGVNVVAIAQGSSELNISIVTAARNRAKALNALHDAFFLAGMRTVNLFLVGTGLVGSTLLAQIAEQRQRLLSERSIRINLLGLSNSRRMLIDPRGIEAAEWREALARAEAADLGSFVGAIMDLNLPSACFCDCTASENPPDYYSMLLDSSIAVVTPNKRANAGSLERYSKIREILREKDVVYGYETTVGAGLPVIGTLRDLVACGDRIAKIEAVLSGTLSFIFNGLGKGKSFSALVLEAKEKGYTEPDPREDLRAVDCARKALILSREAGFPLDSGDIAIEALLPDKLIEAASIEAFLSLLSEADEAIDRLVKAAQARDKVLRYVAEIRPDSASLSLKEYGPESPFYNLSGTDNLVMFTTERYATNPLVVRGPGAGAAVTAGGVFADILKTAQSYF